MWAPDVIAADIRCNSNLIDWAGADIAERFVSAYETIVGEPLHPYWEIASVLEHGPSP